MDWAKTIIAMAPQHILLGGLFAIMIWEMLTPLLSKNIIVLSAKEKNIALPSPAYSWIALYTILLSAFAALYLYSTGFSANVFPNQFSTTPHKSIFVLTIVLLAIPAMVFAKIEHLSPRYYMLMLASIYGATLLPSSDSFIAFFISLEIMSIPVYALVVINFRNKFSPTRKTAPTTPEAVIKYITMGALATTTLLLAISFFLGASGSVSMTMSDFSKMAILLNHADNAYDKSLLLMTISMVLMFIALFIKSSLAPFHFWAPDVYGAATLSTTAYMSVIIKAALFFATLRIFAEITFTPLIVSILFVLPLISILWGNIAAIRQQNFRRLIGYSAIAHAGYMFYAFLGEAGAGRNEAISYYIVVYGFASFLAFVSLQTQHVKLPLPNKNNATPKRDDLIHLKGLFYRSPVSAIMLSIAMLSLAGLPPFPGFIGKFLIFKNVLTASQPIYAVLGLLASFVGIYIYLRVVQLVFTKSDNTTKTPANNLIISLFCLAVLIVCLFAPNSVLSLFN